jgi:hypothetical protein
MVLPDMTLQKPETKTGLFNVAAGNRVHKHSLVQAGVLMAAATRPP